MESIKNNPWWLFWGVLLALMSVLLYNLFGIKPSLAGKQKETRPEVRKIAKHYKESPENVGLDPESMIKFTKKTVCRRNVQYINMMVEMWYLKHEGAWPQPDLSDIGRDKDYFPSGVPVCAVDGSPYRLDPITFRVVGHDHSDIATPDIKTEKQKKQKKAKSRNR